MDPHHRKIDLQSPSDLTYLLSNIHAAAQQKLDQAIPPSAAPNGEDDAFRTKVEHLVHQYITRTLTLALPSLSINGLDASPSLLSLPNPNPTPETHEPYDPRLVSRLHALYAQLELETARVAELRREAPAAAAKAYMDRLNQELEEEEEAVERLREKVRAEASVGVEMEGVGLERAEDVRRTWEGALEGLTGLGRVTETVARCERAERAAEVVEGM
ncbi:Kinetochore Mis14 [Lasallia pustulata]|uniref:Kinetochore Mis14 n=1 Tax=Lasallia pustulata TaxID=136370 RepID=A0A1W5D2L9_9LECA|nr:Kinetochore Mis14 [Lasallia pustulata]